MADEIVTRYKLDTSEFTSGVQTIKQGGETVVQTDEKVVNSFREVNKAIASAFATDKIKKFTTTAAQEVAKLQDTSKRASGELNKTATSLGRVGDQSRKAEKETKSATSALTAMRNQLKSLNSQLLELAAAGKTNTAEFAKLSQEAGELRSRMGDVSSAVQQQAGSAFENLQFGIADTKDALLGLNFGKVSQNLAGMATQVKNVNFASFTKGIRGSAEGLAQLGGAILTSPIFLVGAVVAGIVASLISWESELDKVRAANELALGAIDLRLQKSQAAFDRQIALLKSEGKSTKDAEKEKRQDFIKTTEERLKLLRRERELEVKDAKARIKLARDLGAEEKADRAEKLLAQSDTVKEITKLEIDLLNTKNDIRVADNEAEREADAKRDRKQKEDAEKFKARQLELEGFRKQLRDSQINTIEDERERERKQIIAQFDDRIKAVKGTSQLETDLRLQLEFERNVKLNELKEKFKKEDEKIAEDDLKKKKELANKIAANQLAQDKAFIDVMKEGKDKQIAERLFQADQELAALAEKEILSIELEKAILKKAGEDIAAIQKENNDRLLKDQKEADEKMLSQKATAIKNQIEQFVQFGTTILNIGEAFAALTLQDAEENAKAQKAFAVFQVGLDLATSLGNAIAAATEAGVFSGAAAPFTTVAFIIQLTGAVLGAFAQVKNLLSAEPPSFAEGGFTGEGGKYEPAGIVHKDEWVTPKEQTQKYWDELNAMHTGKFEDLIMEKYIEPVLRAAMIEKKDFESESFADNIAKSMMLQGRWRGDNIVMQLVSNNNKQIKKMDQLIGAVQKKPRVNLRRK